MRAFQFSDVPLAAGPLIASLADPAAGGFASFEGWVRDHNDGRAVRSLEYEAYAELAVKEGERIVAEAIARFGVRRARCVHRVGALALGEIAVWVGVSAPHRAEAFAACRYIIDEVKHRVPIWKKEHYASGDSGWVNCERCAADGLHAHEHGGAAPAPARRARGRPVTGRSRPPVLPEAGRDGHARPSARPSHGPRRAHDERAGHQMPYRGGVTLGSRTWRSHAEETELPAPEEATGSRQEARAAGKARQAPRQQDGRGAAEGRAMSKGMDRKKESRKKPARTAAEKRAAKQEKKALRR